MHVHLKLPFIIDGYKQHVDLYNEIHLIDFIFREIRDAQFLPEKLQSKTAKDLFDHFSKMEHDCSHLFSSLVQGGNLAEMSTHIKAAIDSEQKKAIWVSVSWSDITINICE